MAGVMRTLVAASFCWLVASSLWVYPHSLSYANELIGGPLNGSKHLLGSNVDWGQDLLYFKRGWYTSHLDATDTLILAYTGGLQPFDVGVRVDGYLSPDQPLILAPDRVPGLIRSKHSCESSEVFEIFVISSVNALHDATESPYGGALRVSCTIPQSLRQELLFGKPSLYIGYSMTGFSCKPVSSPLSE